MHRLVAVCYLCALLLRTHITPCSPGALRVEFITRSMHAFINRTHLRRSTTFESIADGASAQTVPAAASLNNTTAHPVCWRRLCGARLYRSKQDQCLHKNKKTCTVLWCRMMAWHSTSKTACVFICTTAGTRVHAIATGRVSLKCQGIAAQLQPSMHMILLYPNQAGHVVSRDTRCSSKNAARAPAFTRWQHKHNYTMQATHNTC